MKGVEHALNTVWKLLTYLLKRILNYRKDSLVTECNWTRDEFLGKEINRLGFIEPCIDFLFFCRNFWQAESSLCILCLTFKICPWRTLWESALVATPNTLFKTGPCQTFGMDWSRFSVVSFILWIRMAILLTRATVNRLSLSGISWGISTHTGILPSMMPWFVCLRIGKIVRF